MIHQKPKSYSPSSYLEIVTPGARADRTPLLVVFAAPQHKMILKHLWWFDWGGLISTNYTVIAPRLAEDSQSSVIIS